MLERGVQSKKRYGAAFVIGTIIFLLIFALSYFLAYFQYGRITDFQGVTGYSVLEKKLSYTFFNESICSEENSRSLSEELGYQGRILEDLENKFGKNNAQVLERKKLYSVLLLEHFQFIQDYNKKCTGDYSTILFFYSNDKNSDESENLGKVLNTAYSRNPNLLIYSFDFNLNSTIVEGLKEKYEIESPNIVVVNDQKLKWPFDLDKLESYLNDTAKHKS